MSQTFDLTRRDAIRLPIAAGAAFFLPSERILATAAAPTSSKSGRALTPDEILAKLLEGNRRFSKGKTTGLRRNPEDFSRLAESQAPMAVIVGCADSRVAPEILFDQGVGDLFVVRVAGNIISGAGAPIKGSIEYAVAELGVSLVMVLGHTNCGAVKAAIKHIDAKDELPGAINDLVNTIKPAVVKAKDQGGDALKNTIKANVEIGVARLQTLPPILEAKVKAGEVKVVGGVYDLATGEVALCR